MLKRVLRSVALAPLYLLILSACGSAQPSVSVDLRAFALLTREEVRSFQLWAFDARSRDGDTVECDGLLARDVLPTDPRLVSVREPLSAKLSEDLRLDALPPGKRTLYIDLFAGENATGRRLGAGCASDVSIVAGQETLVRMRVSEGAP